MSQPQFINGYTAFAQLYASALDPIIAEIVATPTEDTLNTAIVNYLSTTYYAGATTSQYQVLQLNSLMPSTFNTYTGSSPTSYDYFTDEQMVFIQQLSSGLMDGTVEGLAEYLTLMDESLTDSDLSAEEQAPLLMTTATLAAALPYFQAVIATPGSWSGFINPVQAVNEIQISKWLVAIMQGCLVGASFASGVFPATPETSVGPFSNMISIQAGSLATTFGVIALGWVQRPVSINTAQVQLQKATLSTSGSGGGAPGLSRTITHRSFCCFFKSSRSGGTLIGCASWASTAQTNANLNLLG